MPDIENKYQFWLAVVVILCLTAGGTACQISSDWRRVEALRIQAEAQKAPR